MLSAQLVAILQFQARELPIEALRTTDLKYGLPALDGVEMRCVRHPIAAAILFTQMNPAIRTRGFASIEGQFRSHGVPIMECRIMEREAYRAMFAYGRTLRDLDPADARNLLAAIDNASAFANDVIAILDRTPAAAGRTAEVA